MSGIVALVHNVKLFHRWDSQLSTIPVALTCHFTPERGQPCICYTGCNYLSFYSTGGATKYLPYLLHLPVILLHRRDNQVSAIRACKSKVGTCVFAPEMGQLVLLMQGGSGCILQCLLHLPVILLHRWGSDVSAIPVALTCDFTPQVGQPHICHTCLHLPVFLFQRWGSHHWGKEEGGASWYTCCTYLWFCSTSGTASYWCKKEGDASYHTSWAYLCLHKLPQVGQPATDARRKVMHPTIPAALTCVYINFHRWGSQLLMQEGRWCILLYLLRLLVPT